MDKDQLIYRTKKTDDGIKHRLTLKGSNLKGPNDSEEALINEDSDFLSCCRLTMTYLSARRVCGGQLVEVITEGDVPEAEKVFLEHLVSFNNCWVKQYRRMPILETD